MASTSPTTSTRSPSTRRCRRCRPCRRCALLSSSASGRSRRRAGSCSPAGISAPSCSPTRTSRCSSTPRSTSARIAGSRSEALTPTATTLARSVSSCAHATTRIATVRSRHCERPPMPSTSAPTATRSARRWTSWSERSTPQRAARRLRLTARRPGLTARPPRRAPDDDRSSRAMTADRRNPERPKSNAVLEAAYRLDNDQTMLVRVTALLARLRARSVANVRLEGMEHIPRSGPVILAVNHISNLDGVITGAFITDALRRRRIHWLGKREMFEWPFLGWLAANGGVHPVDRGAADVEAFRLATRILDAGHVLLVFPEGTRSPDGALQEAKDGVALLAQRTGAQIVPVGLNNTDAVWRKGAKLPMPVPRRTVTMRVGEPFRLSKILPPDVDRRTAKRLATRAIMGRIAELLDPRHRGVYAGEVPAENAAS